MLENIVNTLFKIFYNKHFLKFVVVGVISTIINFVVFLYLYYILNINYLIASSIGYVSGLCLGFFLNKIWTYDSKHSKKTKKEVPLYFIVYIFSLICSLIILKILVDIFGIIVIIANILVIGFSTVTNFLGTKYIVFKK